MATQEQLQEIIGLISGLLKTIQQKRGELWQTRQISTAEWLLNDRKEMLAFIGNLADSQGYTKRQKMTVFDELEKVLNQASPLTVAVLENELIKLQRDLNLGILDQILGEIEDFGTRIKNATGKLERAINDLNNLNDTFGTITLAVSIFAAVASAAGGKFSQLAGLVGSLI